jgi:hypothetical protein
MRTLITATPVSKTTYEELLRRLEYLAGLWRRTKDDSVVRLNALRLLAYKHKSSSASA